MWRYDKELIMSTTQQEILDAVNNLSKSPWYGYNHDYTSILGGVTRNASGHVVGARVAQVFWRLEIPDNAEVVDSQGSGLELQLADKTTLEWEQQFIEIGLNSSTSTTTVWPNAGKSFGEVSGEAIFFDAFYMAGGYIIMFLYTIVMLGNMNLVHVRLYLTLTGLLSIAMGMVISMGISSLLGFPYTPMHAVLPFICLGIGIDDMFVIVTSYYNILKTGENLSIGERIGQTMRHAGVSVTVTSFTDVFAFGVGAITKMPGLQSFCVCTAIALGCIYVLQVSWFVAWLVLDEKRIINNRNGLVPCITHRQSSQESCCTRLDVSGTFIKFYSKLLSSRLFQVAIVLLTLTFTSVGIGGSYLIRQKFEPELLLPAESYLRQWKSLHDSWYPENGWSAEIYTGHLNHTHLLALDRLVTSLEEVVEEKQYLRGVYPWWNSFKDYTETKTNLSSWTEMTDEPGLFPRLLSDWLFDSSGSGHKPEFRFSGNLSCDSPAPRIEATKIKFAYLLFDGPEEHVPAKRKVEQVIKDSGLEGSFSFVKVYAAWETDEIIGQELWRNIGLALAAIFSVIVILLANFRISLMVFLTVVLTLVDIVGFLHFWDITIDIISCVNIVLAVGLCVDYSVHIGHAFLVSRGSSGQRTASALATIGSAVFNGGLTTFLALVLLGLSTSHVFISFFKVYLSIDKYFQSVSHH